MLISAIARPISNGGRKCAIDGIDRTVQPYLREMQTNEEFEIRPAALFNDFLEVARRDIAVFSDVDRLSISDVRLVEATVPFSFKKLTCPTGSAPIADPCLCHRAQPRR